MKLCPICGEAKSEIQGNMRKYCNVCKPIIKSTQSANWRKKEKVENDRLDSYGGIICSGVFLFK